ncbi:MAG: diaminopimelate epimerase [Candidatus Alcyoniella australis]|nr:diaminopimelate epimerase [Candidatus Alcyoniella australis]
MKPIGFYKATGAGNDFILIDARSGYPDPDRSAELVRAVCRRKLSLGADGVIMVLDDPQYDFQWRFFNADGSEAEMCGNGARCAARFAHELGMAGTKMTFRTLAGPIQAELTTEGARIKVTDPGGFEPARRMDLAGRELDVWFIDSGVPHAVVFIDDLDSFPVEKLGGRLRFHRRFASAGANANFAQVDQGRLLLRTYERGVEAETLACGTGAVASALIAHLAHGLQSPVSVVTRSGETLIVDFVPAAEPGVFRDVYLAGPARMIARGEILPEAL